MTRKLLRLLTFSGISILFFANAHSQNCIPTGINGTVVNLACNQVCTNLNFQIPHIKGTSDYVVNSIPYAAYPYTNATGTPVTSIYIDDEYSGLIPMQMGFCFYEQVYSNMVIGSNGVVTFEQICANESNAYTLTVGGAPQPIPYNGGAGPTGIATTYYPRTAIMGAYHDINPNATPLPGRRIEYNLFGTAPCRKMVISYFDIRMFGSSCQNLICSEQIVLHESTGIIEVFLLNKPICPSWPSGAGAGLAILGIQDETRTKAVAAPGKNATQWSESNTGYRFTPSGGGSRYVISELLDASNNVVAVADTITTTAGLLDLSFPNFCPPAGSNTYTVRTTFSACDNPATQLISLDQITINRTNDLNASHATTNTACGPPSGTITVTVPPGVGTAPYTFVLDGGTPVVGPSPYTFTGVAAGPHTIVVTDFSGGCTSTINTTVNLDNGINATPSFTGTSCPSVNNGTITIDPQNGTAPFSYSLDGGPSTPGPDPMTFTGLSAGNHTIIVTDAAGCVSTPIVVNVTAGPALSANAVPSATSCDGATNGSVTVTPTSGTGPYTFVLDGGAQTQTGATATFNGLSAGPHTIVVTDNPSGCQTNTLNFTVLAGPTLLANAVPASTSCNGAANGSITVTPTNGTAPYTFSVDGGAFLSGASPYTFTNLAAGAHTIRVTDASGCMTNIINVNVAVGPTLTTTVSKTDALCNGASTGSITVTQPSIGTAPYEYSLDGTNWQSSNVFNGLAAGTYTVYYREADGCQGSQSITVAEPAVMTSSSSMVPVVCNGEGNGIITITAGGGVTPYEYSIDGGANWQSSNIFNVPAGTYTVTIRDANGCTRTETINVTEPVVLSALSNNGDASCDGGDDGVITVTANGGNPGYTYSLDAVNFQSSNVFNVGPGNYTVTVRDNLGCETSFNTTVGLNSNFSLTPQADVTICEGTSTQLSLTSNATQYSWSPGTGLSSTTIHNPVANPTVTTTYTVTATLGRCSGTDDVIVNVNAAPIPDAGPDGYICYGQTYQLQGSGGNVYAWTPSTYLDNTSISNPVSTPDKDIIYTLAIVSDANGCASLTTDQVRIDVTPPIKINTYPYDTVAYNGDLIPLLAVPSDTDVINFLWSPTIGLSDPTIANPTATVGAIGEVTQYQVTGTTIAGCKGEGYVTVRVYKGPDIYVPTGFTPNGDGRNDRFTPFPVGVKSYKYFRIFNRWGQLVFSTSTLHHGWDGKFQGVEQPNGVYVWMIEGITKDNRVITKKGTVAIIR